MNKIEILKEIINEDRPTHWCSKCEKWIDPKYSSGYTFCASCNNDIDDGRDSYWKIIELIKEFLKANESN